MNEAVRKLPQGDKPGAHYREAPSNIEAEQALLGAVLVNNDAYYRVSDFLKPVHLHEPLHRKIYEVCGDIIRMGKTANPVTIKTFLPSDEKVGELTIAQYLARLAAEAVTIINAEDYGRAIYDLALRRALITIGEDMVNIAFDAPLDMPPQGQIEDAERRLFELAENGRYDGGFQSFNDAVALAIDMAGAAYQRDGGLSGVSTGIHTLDLKMGGLQQSDLIILAGRPGMGKTSLATNIAFNIAQAFQAGEIMPDGTQKTANGGIVGFYSLEMSAEQLATRIISEQTEISSSKIRRGAINEADFEKLVGCSQMMQKIPLYIDQTGGISIAQMSARARRLKRQRGLDVLVVDYVQLMTGSKKSGENRVQEITEITTGLKALAKELNVPIVALSQLSRQVENREDKRPQLSDLRESGSIEQDADVVLFVFREEYYIQNQEPRRSPEQVASDFKDEQYLAWEEKMSKVKGMADVIVAKQRHGPTGTVTLGFQAEFTRFSDLADTSYLQYSHE